MERTPQPLEYLDSKPAASWIPCPSIVEGESRLWTEEDGEHWVSGQWAGSRVLSELVPALQMTPSAGRDSSFWRESTWKRISPAAARPTSAD